MEDLPLMSQTSTEHNRCVFTCIKTKQTSLKSTIQLSATALLHLSDEKMWKDAK